MHDSNEIFGHLQPPALFFQNEVEPRYKKHDEAPLPGTVEDSGIFDVLLPMNLNQVQPNFECHRYRRFQPSCN